MKIEFNETEKFRVDKFLAMQESEDLISRSFINKLISDGNVTVNSKPVKKSYILSAGEIIEIELPEKIARKIEGQDLNLEVVYEDQYLAVINKPAGMTVHPAPGNFDNTLVNGIVHLFGNNVSSGSESNRPGIVHRLDKGTTGLVIVAKDDLTHVKLSKMFQNREIDKFYKAICSGRPQEDSGTIETLIERSKTDRKKMAVSDTGKLAITHYEVEEFFDFFSLMKVKLETGRTHQIRVHFSNMNLPILGDETYSNLKRALNMIPYHMQKKAKQLLNKRLTRQALHAYCLEFIHPRTNAAIKVEIPLPEDMQYTLDWLRKNFITT